MVSNFFRRQGHSAGNSLAATLSDNTIYGPIARYDFSRPTIDVGYENLRYADPSIALPTGFSDIGAYVPVDLKNTAYTTTEKILQVSGAGVKYPVLENSDVSLGYSPATVDSWTKRFDADAGDMYTHVSHRITYGNLGTTNINPIFGVRVSF